MTWTEYNKVNLWGCSSTWCCTLPLPLPHRSAMTPVCPVHQHHSHVSIHYDHNVPLLSMYLVVLLISNTSWNVSMKYYIYVQFSIVKHVVLVLITHLMYSIHLYLLPNIWCMNMFISHIFATTWNVQYTMFILLVPCFTLCQWLLKTHPACPLWNVCTTLLVYTYTVVPL